MLFFERPRLDLTSKAAGGEATSLGEIWDSTTEAMRLVDNAGSKVAAADRAYDERIDAIQQATGEQLPNPLTEAKDPRDLYYPRADRPAYDPHAIFQRQLEEVAERHPDQRAVIAPDRPVIEDAKRKAREAEKRFEDAWSRSDGGIAAWSARLGGGFYGMLHDPANVATLAIGPAGPAGAGVRGLAWMALKQGVANAGAEAAIQPSVQAWRKEAGLDYGLSHAALNIAGAGAFGAGIDAGVRSAIRGVRRAAGNPYLGPDASPVVALDRAAKAAPEGSVLKRAAEGDEAALREIAKATGQDADPIIKRALDEAEIDKLFPSPLNVDDGAHLENLARAIRGESGAPDLPPGDAIIAPAVRQVADLADETPGRALEIEGKPISFRAIDPREVTTDAATFQFKSGGDAGGVTDRLRGVTKWDPVSAGKTIVFERADGRLVIADGHQRLGLAQRLSAEGKGAELDAYVFREADGWTPEDVRAYAALKNMRESSGSSLDMAQVMRDRPDLIDGSLPLTDAKLRDAAMLARLSPEAFDAVVAGRLSPHYAAMIGESVPNGGRHFDLLNEMAAANPANTQQARLYLKQLMELPTTTETQMTLFGEEAFTRSVMLERVQVLDSALKTLKSDKRIFGFLESQARTIESAGNVLARETNAAKAENAAQLADLIEKLATSRGPVATILNDAAASVARGFDSKLASRAFVDRIAGTLEREGLAGLTRVDEAPTPDLAPVRMEEPNGPEAKAQTEEINWALELDDEIRFAIRAYHGTPHDFDRFDISKIGTGEGAQVFGHGLYFAENKGVAESYQLSVSDAHLRSDPVAQRIRRVMDTARSDDHAREQLRANGDDEALSRFDGVVKTMRGNLYEVEIDVKPEQLLDWNKPLSKQSKAVRAALQSETVLARLFEVYQTQFGAFAVRGVPEPDRVLLSKAEAEDYASEQAAKLFKKHTVRDVIKSASDPSALSAALREAGIPGVRYLDQGSRGVGEGSRNIVIFDDSLVKITAKNGKPVSTKEREQIIETMFSLRQSIASLFRPAGDVTQTPFKKWFGDSKVVDESGKPLVVYHGTNASFEAFDPERSQGGIFFSSGTHLLDRYAQSEGGNAIPAHLKIERPAPTYQAFVDDTSGKYDGYFSNQTYVVRKSEQVKSVFNRGSFDPNDPRISFSVSATLRDTTLTEAAAERMAEIRPEIDKVISVLPPGWRAEVRERLVFGDLSERTRQRNPGIKPSLELEGTFDPYERIIYVSMAATDPVERAWEEAGHILRKAGLIPDADYAILRAKALEIGARERFDIDKRYGEVYGARYKDNPGKLEEALEEEAVMQMVAARARGESFDKPTDGILDKLLKFFRAVREMLTGKGLRNFEDVFADISEGRFARGAEAQSGDAMASYAGDGVMSTAFKRWFGDSKVVDERGKPLVVYHGTARGGFDEFDTYGSRYGLMGQGAYFTENPTVASSYTDKGIVKMRQAGQEAQTVYPVHLSIKNPINMDGRADISAWTKAYSDYLDEADIRDRFGDSPTNEQIYREVEEFLSSEEIPSYEGAEIMQDGLRAMGHDGITHVGGGRVDSDGVRHRVWIAFDPEQIKSSIGNRGTFDPNDPRISFALPGTEHDTFLAQADAASQIMFSLPDEGKGVQLPAGRAAKQVRDLINQAAAAGHLPREDADGLIARYDMLEQFHKDGGKARAQIAKEITAEAEQRKRQKALAEAAKRMVQNHLVNFRDARGQPDPAKAMVALIENLGQHELPEGMVSVANHQHAIFGMSLAKLDAMLHEFKGADLSASGIKVALTGTTRNKARLSNVVRELFGEKTGDEMAAGFALAASGVMEDLRLRFNAGGGAIGKRKNWGLPQWHDQVALLRAGRQAWVDFVRPLLNPKSLKHPLTGDDLAPGDVNKMLEDIWDNIASDGWHEKEAEMGRRGLSAIANTRGDPRMLIFANADAWMKYSERFGGGPDALGIIVNHIKSMSRDIAAMEVLGPNPGNMLKFMQDFVNQQAKLQRAGMTAVFPPRREFTGLKFSDPTSYARSMSDRAENMWNIYNGRASAPVNATFAGMSQGVRSLNVAFKLGGATVSALTDPFWQLAARKFAGLPVMKTFSDVIKQMMPGSEREMRQAALISETYLHMHSEGAREAAALSFTGVSNYLADRVLTLSMLNSVTRAGNHAMGMRIQAHMADLTTKSFGELAPQIQRFMRRYGLSASDWEAMRLDANGQPRQDDFLNPATMRDDLRARGLDPKIAERYLGAMLSESQYATLTGTLRAKAITMGNTRSGTLQGEFWRHLLQFKSFAANLWILQIERMAREFVSQGLWRGAQYGAFALTAAVLGGALVTQLQQLRNGKDPQNMDPATPEGAKFWARSLIQSGGLSIWGDLLSAAENRVGGGVAGTIAGPTAGTIQDIASVTLAPASRQVRRLLGSDEKTNYGREATNFVRRYTPGASLWYVRTAWERVLMDNLQRMLDPEADKSFRRKIQNAKKDYGQSFWWKPGGGAIPQRGPRLNAVLGAQ